MRDIEGFGGGSLKLELLVNHLLPDLHPQFLVYQLVAVQYQQDAASVVLHAFIDESEDLVDGQLLVLALDVINDDKAAL